MINGYPTHSRLSEIVASDADCFAVRPEFESRRRHGDTLNSSRAASPLVRSEEEEERWEAHTPPAQDILPQKWGGTELNHTVTCMVLDATANDMRTSSTLP
ncbi:hypothetical protein TNCV_4969041 [Trichonephila clavipes]|nr:hypothetical protein TNCV_4969041 [Trichonephila clavipes]